MDFRIVENGLISKVDMDKGKASTTCQLLQEQGGDIHALTQAIYASNGRPLSEYRFLDRTSF